MKRKKIMAGIMICALAISSVGCGQTVAKKLGGTYEVELPEKTKLLNVTWKDDSSLWYLTRPMKEDEEAETYTFQEDSKWGVMEGKVVIKEKK